MRQIGRGHIWTGRKGDSDIAVRSICVSENLFSSTLTTNAPEYALFCSHADREEFQDTCTILPRSDDSSSLERASKDATQWKVISWSSEGVRNGHIPFSLIFSIPSLTYLGRFTTHLTRGSVPITRVPSSFCAWPGMGPPLLLSL